MSHLGLKPISEFIFLSSFILLHVAVQFSQHQLLKRLLFLLRFIYLLTVSETASEGGNTSRGRGRGRSRLPVEEPDMGLDPRTPGSRPEPKADA